MRCTSFRQVTVLLVSGLLGITTVNLQAKDLSASHRDLNEKSMAQQHQKVTVVVSDNAGELIGANVLVKGTTNGNVTDIDGRVVLQDVPANAVLEISFIGYKTKEVPVKGQNLIRVTLSEDSETLDEVVVVGYGTMEKKQVTSAVTSLSAMI